MLAICLVACLPNYSGSLFFIQSISGSARTLPGSQHNKQSDSENRGPQPNGKQENKEVCVTVT